MRTLYLRNVPDEVVRRLRRRAGADATSVDAVAVCDLIAASRRADNPGLLGTLAGLSVEAVTVVDDLYRECADR